MAKGSSLFSDMQTGSSLYDRCFVRVSVKVTDLILYSKFQCRSLQ